jgi:hypothetical protein
MTYIPQTGSAPIVYSDGNISLSSTSAIIQSNAIIGTTLNASGLTGATSASRYVGATSVGAAYDRHVCRRRLCH